MARYLNHVVLLLLLVTAAVTTRCSTRDDPMELQRRFRQGQAWAEVHRCSRNIAAVSASPFGWRARGLAYLQLGLYPQAIEDLKMSESLISADQSLDPISAQYDLWPGGRFLLGWARVQSGDREGGLGEFERVVDHSTDDASLTLALEALGRAPEARLKLRQSRDASTRYKRGLLLLNLGQFRRAEEELSLALEIEPEDALIRADRSLARLESGDFSGSLADSLVLQNEFRPAPWAAWARFLCGDTSLSANPPRPDQGALSLNARAHGLLAQGMAEDALVLLEQAARLEPDNPFYQEEKAEALRRLGRDAEAEGCRAAAARLKRP